MPSPNSPKSYSQIAEKNHKNVGCLNPRNVYEIFELEEISIVPGADCFVAGGLNSILFVFSPIVFGEIKISIRVSGFIFMKAPIK